MQGAKASHLTQDLLKENRKRRKIGEGGNPRYRTDIKEKKWGTHGKRKKPNRE